MTNKKKLFQLLAVAMLVPGGFVLGIILGLLAAALLLLGVCAAVLRVALEWLIARGRAFFFASFGGSAPKTGTDDAGLPGDHVPLPKIVRVPPRERWLQ